MKKTKILTEAPRRRSFTTEMKTSILAKMAEPGTTIVEIYRRHEVSQALLYNWRRVAVKQSSFIMLVPSEARGPQFSTSRTVPLTRITSGSGIVIEFAAAISLDDIVSLVNKLGGRS